MDRRQVRPSIVRISAWVRKRPRTPVAAGNLPAPRLPAGRHDDDPAAPAAGLRGRGPFTGRYDAWNRLRLICREGEGLARRAGDGLCPEDRILAWFSRG